MQFKPNSHATLIYDFRTICNCLIEEKKRTIKSNGYKLLCCDITEERGDLILFLNIEFVGRYV
jgi:hypothetical protein